MKIFISHSVIDKDVAKEFKDLFVDFGKDSFDLRDEIFKAEDVFLSSDITSDQRKDDQWRKNFEEYLGDCSHFLVLVTPDSLNSRWVQYEIGFASALNKKIIPIGIKGVSPEGFLLRDCGMQMIEEQKDVKKLIKLVFTNEKDKLINLWCSNNMEVINNLLESCKERCVYIVGSIPQGEKERRTWIQEQVTDFIKRITKALLDKGIKVSSFPTVDEVGAIVCAEAMKSHPKMYEISGLYNFDKLFEEKDMKDIPQDTWRDILKGFRKLYLENKSGMIILGGGIHTEDEYKVAEEIKHLEIFPIRCLGGFGKKLFDKKLETYKKMAHPCTNCKNGELPCDQLDEFVKRLGHYNFIDDEDERESK